jgi:hypothetical protein
MNLGEIDDVFLGRRGFERTDPNTMVFDLVFYKTVKVLAFTTNNPRDHMEDYSHPDYVAARMAERDAKKKQSKQRSTV